VAGNITVQTALTSLPGGSVSQSTNIPGNSSNEYNVTTLTPASGANTITVPSFAAGAIIRPASTNTQTLTLKGVTGDTGVAISKINPTVISFDTSPPANFVLTAGGAFSTILEVDFF
jgi:hypothetical protein